MCFQVFNGLTLMNKHRDAYHELGDYICDLCPTPTPHLTKCHLEVHKQVGNLKILSMRLESELEI